MTNPAAGRQRAGFLDGCSDVLGRTPGDGEIEPLSRALAVAGTTFCSGLFAVASDHAGDVAPRRPVLRDFRCVADPDAGAASA